MIFCSKRVNAVVLFAFIIGLLLLILKGTGIIPEKASFHKKTHSSKSSMQEEYWPTDGWRTSTPEEQGMDSGKLADMIKDIEKFYPVRSVLVVRHGYLVLESYAAPYDKDTAFNVKSVSKSILSALAGIAIREKLIESVDQNVAELLPEYFKDTEPRKKKITIHNLLAMTSGLPSVEEGQYQLNWTRSKDWVKHVVDLPMNSNPGSSFSYSTGLTHIMSAIITKTSGVNTLEFARKYLFGPMGIEAKRWSKDPNGLYIGGSELDLTPRDMAKFGYLYLRNGRWDKQQLIPEEWVKKSTKNHVNGTSFGNPANEYGYWWWLGKDYYFASGWGGQYIIVNPKQDMVVVFTSIDVKGPLELYKNRICSAVRSDFALEPNSVEFERLKTNIERLASTKNDYAAPDSKLLEKMNGKIFKCKNNKAGLDSFSLSFKDSSCIFSYEQTDNQGLKFSSELPVGLDGKYQITTESRPVYYSYDRLFFPVSVQGGVDKYPVAAEGHWMGSNCFVLKCLGPLGDPFIFMAIFEFNGNKVNIRLTAAPTTIQFNIDGSMAAE